MWIGDFGPLLSQQATAELPDISEGRDLGRLRPVKRLDVSGSLTPLKEWARTQFGG